MMEVGVTHLNIVLKQVVTAYSSLDVFITF